MDRVKFDDAISSLKKVDPYVASIVEEGIKMMETSVFFRELTDDEKMISYSSYLTGILLGNVEASLEAVSNSVPSLN